LTRSRPMPPAAPITFPGSGGGLFGAVKNALLANQVAVNYFKIQFYAGRQPPGAILPYVVLTHINFLIEDHVEPNQTHSQRYDGWKATFQVSTYAEGYDAARVLAALVNRILGRQTLRDRTFPITVYPVSKMLTLDLERTGSGNDVWHAAYRYSCHTIEEETPDQGAAGITDVGSL
jgi:hypothetical protein